MSTFGFRLYLLFVCSWFLHLPARIPGMESARADLLLVGTILLLTLLMPKEAEAVATDSRTRTLLWTLVAYAALSIPFVEWPGSVARIGFPNFFKAFVFYYFTAKLVTTEGRLRKLLMTFLACQMFRVFEPLYLHVTDGYWGSAAMMSGWEMMNRLAGAPNDVVNPNGLASIVLTIVPLLHYLTAGNVKGRLIYLAAMPPLVWALILTGSRSGMLGLGAIAVQVWWKSRQKIMLTATLVAAVIIALPYLDANLSDRYRSIFDSNTRNATTSHDRMDGLKMNLDVAMRRPLFGYGLGTSREANWHYGATDLPAHNLYLEALQEVGIFGTLIFVAVVGSVVMGLRRIAEALRRATSPPPILLHLVPALQVLIGMNVLFSFASYGLSMYDWYLAAGLTDVIVRLLATTTAAAPVAAPVAVRAPFVPRAPLRPLPLRP
jgi:putative inorganic carbon (hco3(-)) transporter